MEFLAAYGYCGLFLAAFLAATILPLSSEAVLLFLISQGQNALLLVFIASAGNVAGSVLNYYVGLKGEKLILHKWLHLSKKDAANAENTIQKYGKPALLLAWVPIIGDPLTFIAGVFRIAFGWFLFYVTIGKALRYIVLVWGMSFI